MLGLSVFGGSASSGRVALLLLLGAQLVSTYKLDVASPESVKSVASSMAEDMLSFYNGNKPGGTPGLLPEPPYYWWEGGAMMGALIDYWYYTGDTRWNQLVQDGLLHQVGPNRDYMPPNQTLTEGNDDQGFWAMSVMSAAEYNFDNPPADQPQWLALAQAVFNTQAPRWETADCNGGLRWQIFTWNKGFDYKNSISQACFFALAARLALYTGNQSYAAWADKTWDWMVGVQFLNTDTYYVYDGASTQSNCTKIVPYQWSYNAGGMLLGAAAMYNYSTTEAQRDLWRERVDGLINGTMVFFTGDNSNVMAEVACEPVNLCDTDQQSFKAYLSRWMATTTKWCPWTYKRIKPLLEASAVAAAAQCNGGGNGRMCGLKWTTGGVWDGSTGVGQQMAAMEVVLATMIHDVSPPVTDTNGGTSQGDPAAGSADVGRTEPQDPVELMAPIRTRDKAGAYAVTVALIMTLLAGMIFMLVDETSNKTARERWIDLRQDMATAPGALALLAKGGRRRLTAEEKGKGIERTDSEGSDGRNVNEKHDPPRTSETPLPGHPRADDAYYPQHWRRTLRAGDLEGAVDSRRFSGPELGAMPHSHPDSRVRELSKRRERKISRRTQSEAMNRLPTHEEEQWHQRGHGEDVPRHWSYS